MIFEILIFLFLGILIGLIAGLVPGIHPNTIVLFIPLLFVAMPNTLSLLVFIAAMAVSNIIADFIPSLLFGAADAEQALGIHPSQIMLSQGRGYEAIKLSITGALGSGLLLIAIMPLLIFAIPGIYELSKPVIHLILIIIVGLMLYHEKNKPLSLLCFLAAGAVGVLSFRLPVDSMMLLFPILAGFFAIPALLMKMKNRSEIPEQNTEEQDIMLLSSKVKSIAAGAAGGIASGFLPGIGTSEIAGIATIDKRKENFLIALGAIALTNIMFSFVAVYLIGKARSGVALAASAYIEIGFNEILVIMATAIIALAISAVIILFISKKLLNRISSWNYLLINKLVLALIIIMIFYFTQFYGLFLAVLCACLGLIVIQLDVKRGLLMGVLIIPTILFYMGF